MILACVIKSVALPKYPSTEQQVRLGEWCVMFIRPVWAAALNLSIHGHIVSLQYIGKLFFLIFYYLMRFMHMCIRHTQSAWLFGLHMINYRDTQWTLAD